MSRLALLIAVLLIAQNCSDGKRFENVSGATSFGFKQLEWDTGNWDEGAWSDE